MTKEQYLEIRHDELQLIFHHITECVKLPYVVFVQFIMNWQRLMITSQQMMYINFKINFNPSEAYHMLVNYYDGKFELQLLYDSEGKLIKIII